MSYLAPSEFVTKMVDAGESKIFMSTRDTVIRAYIAGVILALAAWFAVTINVNTGQPLIGALLFPVGFVMLYLLGVDLLTGVFVLSPLAWLDKRPGVTLGGVLRNWGLVFVGNFAGALTVAFRTAAKRRIEQSPEAYRDAAQKAAATSCPGVRFERLKQGTENLCPIALDTPGAGCLGFVRGRD
jgi:formate/nitrite transporter FocA (FNT family)